MLVRSGQTLLHASSIESDRRRRAARYLGRNKTKMAGSGAKLLIAGLLTGPIGLGVAVGAAVVMPLIKLFIKSVKTSRATGRVAAGRAAGIKITKTVQGTQPGMTFEVANDDFASLMTDIGYLCAHGTLSQVLNGFAELDNDARALALLNTETPVIGDCDIAWGIQEHIERVFFRVDKLADVIELLDELTTFVVLQTSGMDEDFESLRLSVLYKILLGSDHDGKKALATLNQAANSSKVFNHMYGFRKDYTEWIKKSLKYEFYDGAFSATGLAAVNLTAKAAATQAASIAVKAGYAALAHGAHGNAAVAGLSEQSSGLATGLASGAAGGASAGAGILVDVAVEALTSYLDMKNLREGRSQIDSLNKQYPRMIDMLAALDPEVVISFRASTKKILETLMSKFDHLMIAHRELESIRGSADVQILAEGLLRRQKLRDQVEELKGIFGAFYEVTVGKAIAFRLAAEDIQRRRSGHVLRWLSTHSTGTCAGKVCYQNSKMIIEREYAEIDVTLSDLQAQQPGITWDMVKNNWNDVPYHPAVGAGLKDALEAQSLRG